MTEAKRENAVIGDHVMLPEIYVETMHARMKFQATRMMNAAAFGRTKPSAFFVAAVRKVTCAAGQAPRRSASPSRRRTPEKSMLRRPDHARRKSPT